MKNWISNLKNAENGLFSCFVLLFLGLGFLSVILTIFSIFYSSIIVIYLVLAIVFLIWAIARKKIEIKINRPHVVVFLIILVAAIIFSAFSSPTIFSGRDQGSFSEAAIRLSQNHQLEFSTTVSEEFFQIYGPGKALNFPGFDYLKNGSLITQFPIGYISWLGAFFAIFGYLGLQIANIVSLIIFFFSFYLLVEKFSKKRTTPYFALGIILTSFIFYWFSKFTLSENLAWMLVWFGIYKFSSFWEKEKKVDLVLAFLAFGLFLFVRIEAIAFLVMIFILLLKKYRGRSRELFRRNFNSLLGAITLLYAGVIFVNQNFYSAVLKSFLKPFMQNGSSERISWLSLEIYLGNVFSFYSILVVIVFGIMGMIYFLRKKRYDVLIPIFIVLPSFYYLVAPNISIDHPWMLRRFAFSIYPALCFLAIILLEDFLRKKFYRYSILYLIIFSNFALFFFYLPIVPHHGISLVGTDVFSQKDLILVDRMATGDPYSMISGPLSFQRGLNAVYFFNLEDLGKIDLEKFEKVYFIIPNQSVSFYEEGSIMNRLKLITEFQIKNTILNKNLTKSKQEIIKEELVPLLNVEDSLTLGGIYQYQK